LHTFTLTVVHQMEWFMHLVNTILFYFDYILIYWLWLSTFDTFIEYFLCHSYIFSPNPIVFNSNKVW
jgi:hypothetical protein